MLILEQNTSILTFPDFFQAKILAETRILNSFRVRSKLISIKKLVQVLFLNLLFRIFIIIFENFFYRAVAV